MCLVTDDIASFKIFERTFDVHVVHRGLFLDTVAQIHKVLFQIHGLFSVHGLE